MSKISDAWDEAYEDMFGEWNVFGVGMMCLMIAPLLFFVLLFLVELGRK